MKLLLRGEERPSKLLSSEFSLLSLSHLLDSTPSSPAPLLAMTDRVSLPCWSDNKHMWEGDVTRLTFWHKMFPVKLEGESKNVQYKRRGGGPAADQNKDTMAPTPSHYPVCAGFSQPCFSFFGENRPPSTFPSCKKTQTYDTVQ